MAVGVSPQLGVLDAVVLGVCVRVTATLKVEVELVEWAGEAEGGVEGEGEVQGEALGRALVKEKVPVGLRLVECVVVMEAVVQALREGRAGEGVEAGERVGMSVLLPVPVGESVMPRERDGV